MKSKKFMFNIKTRTLHYIFNISFVLVIVSFVVFALANGKSIRVHNQQYLEKDATMIANRIDSELMESPSNPQLLKNLSKLMNSEYFGIQTTSFLCDPEGFVVASNVPFNENEKLDIKTAMKADLSLCKKLTEAFENKENLSFDYGYTTGYMVRLSESGFYLVQIFPLEANKLMRKEANTIAFILVAVILFIFIVLLVIIKGSHRYQRAQIEDQLGILQSVAEIYYSMHLINIPDLTMIEYRAEGSVKKIMDMAREKNLNAYETIKTVMINTVAMQHLHAMLEFTNVMTIGERMKGKKFMSLDFLGKSVGWVRSTFITIEVDDDGVPIKVIHATQVIDAERRREEELLKATNTDDMTGLLNRRAYDAALNDEEHDVNDTIIISIDLNGLKRVNDNYGHNAGDELIVGAAECLSMIFDKKGLVFRTGGDEFFVIIHGSKEYVADLFVQLETTLNQWKGQYTSTLHLSYGYAAKCDYPGENLEHLALIADKAMYEAKNAYYLKNNLDRRQS